MKLAKWQLTKMRLKAREKKMEKFDSVEKSTVGEFANDEYRSIRETTSGAVTNGNWLLLKDYCPKPLVKRIAYDLQSPDDSDIYPDFDGSEKVARVTKKTIQVKSRIRRVKKQLVPLYVVKTEVTAMRVAFKRKYVNYLNRWLKEFDIRIVAPGKPAFIISEGFIVGLLMPFKLSEGE